MNNDPRPKFDPETGRPLDPQPAEQPAPQAAPQPRFDPETGRPLTPPPAQPQTLHNEPPTYTPPQPGQNYTGGSYNAAPPPPEHKPTNGMAIGSLICGILSLICCCCGWMSVILGIVAIILGVLSKKGEGKMSGMALGGVICGAVGAGLALISAILSIAMSGVVGDLGYYMEDFMYGLEDAFY